MSLIVGVRVRRQDEGHMGYGQNPKGSKEEITKRLWEHLEKALPRGGWGGVGVSQPTARNDWYDFDCQVFEYGGVLNLNGYTQHDLYLAMVGFILQEFSVIEGIEMKVYWSG